MLKVDSVLARHCLTNIIIQFRLKVVQNFILKANCPVGEPSCRRTVLLANCPVGCRRTVLSANCPVGELSVGELSVGELSVGELSVYQN